MNWFYAKDGQQVGPVSLAEIQRLRAEGQLTDDTLVWQQGTANWVKLSTLEAEVPAAPTAPPLAPLEPIGNTLTGEPSLVMTAKTNSLAVTSLILGILSLVCCGIILGPAAAVCGHIALASIKNNPGQGGRGLAIAGLALGYLSLVLNVIFLSVYWPEFKAQFDAAMAEAAATPAPVTDTP